MELTLSLVGVGGDARLSFTKDHIRLTWGETSQRERRAIKSLVEKARKAKFGVVTVDADGKADKPTRWRDLPGLFGAEKGEILLQGSGKAIGAIAAELMAEEILDHNLVMTFDAEARTWKVISKGETTALAVKAETEKVEVKSTRPIVGG